ncbi:MAG: helix-turn-helix transcriptional regulator [Desulfovibrio sp.]|uniref:helix-turn-helix domain-containing protein n=1 Tax=Desulfovibrio sp. TaxID=885 RepID=UPI0025BD4C9C|nr:helix-turn-helix transcriptional regulator [Desulfovibrio sp.]MBS6829061.1 helix-turn-helix transcriptional regulator [Desulfovibrio sp.]
MPEYSKNDLKVLKAFGEVVRNGRKALDDISQEELAERAGLHRTYLGGVEQGRRNLSLLNIMKIAKALEVEPEELFAAMPKPKKKAKAGS